MPSTPRKNHQKPMKNLRKARRTPGISKENPGKPWKFQGKLPGNSKDNSADLQGSTLPRRWRRTPRAPCSARWTAPTPLSCWRSWTTTTAQRRCWRRLGQTPGGGEGRSQGLVRRGRPRGVGPRGVGGLGPKGSCKTWVWLAK